MRCTQNAIEVKNLYKNFKVAYDKPQTLKERLVSLGSANKTERRIILENISLDIKKGETVALIGTNGSGKSTLLKLMTKILYPNKGTLETQGKLTSLLELGAGFHQDFTGRENIYFNASIFGLTRKEIDDRLDTIIDFSELGEFIDNPVRTYSSGMYMRLAFSVAINVDAEILLIDEILAVGDQHFQKKCFEKLEELRDGEKTIVIVSHNLEVVRKICNRAVWIYKGNLQLDGEPSEVIDAYLAQVTSDYEVVEKEDNFEGMVFIDEPVSFLQVENNQSFKLRGWELDDCRSSTMKAFIDGNEISGIDRYPRMDVFAVYETQFGGFKLNTEAGWETYADISCLEVGAHVVKVSVYDTNGKEIANEESTFYIK